MKNIFSLILLSICFINALFAQDFHSDMKKMSAVYNEKSFETKMKIEVKRNQSIMMTKNAHIKKNDDNYWYKIDEAEMLFNDKYSIMVSHIQQSIVISKMEKGENRYLPKSDSLLLNGMDSLMNKNTWVYQGTKNGKIHYRINNNESVIQQVDIYLSEYNYTIHQIHYDYNDELMGDDIKVSIVFSGTHINPPFDNGDFSEKQYIYQKDKTWKAKQSYQSYEVLEVE